MVSSIVNSLGFGSGIDTKQLITDLADASRAPKVERIATLTLQNTTKISAVAQARADLDGFADSLELMVTDGTLRSKATSSDDSVMTVTARAGMSANSFAATVVVNQLARAQTSVSAVVADNSAAIGQGSMTLAVGDKSFAITIDATNDSLNGLVNAINKSGSGVTASLVSDEGGSRLVLKGATGAANAFTLTADDGSDANLSQFSYGDGGSMALGQSAANAEFTVDGIAFSRSSNIVDDVLGGMSITLKKTSAGQPVEIGASRPLDLIRQTVGDFVSVYNQLKKSIVEAGKMSGIGSTMRELEADLNAMVNKMLTSHPTINTLSSIGVSTNKDGILVLDQRKLDGALASDADAVEQIFNPRRDATHNTATDPGISGVLDAIRDKAVAPNGALERMKTMLESRQKTLNEQLEKIETRETAYRARLEKQYSGLDSKLAAFKATQSYLEQQVEIWNNQYSN
jgi:flagellar hook-associated protein 2